MIIKKIENPTVVVRCFILAKVLDTLYTICRVFYLLVDYRFLCGYLEYYRTQVNTKSKNQKCIIYTRSDLGKYQTRQLIKDGQSIKHTVGSIRSGSGRGFRYVSISRTSRCVGTDKDKVHCDNARRCIFFRC